jgi:hypothetical protein
MSSFIPWQDATALLLAANLVPADHVHLSNEPFNQPQDALWMSVTALSNALDVVDMGGTAWREEGTLMIYCCAPAGTGTDALRVLAKNVCNVYRGLPPRNPYYQNCSIGDGGLSDAGDYYVMPVSVEFFFED